MSYAKEIVLFKKKEYQNLSALKILGLLNKKNWTPTLLIIDRGNDFNWIDSASIIEFEEILNYKTKMKEYIGFTLKHADKDKFVTVNIKNDEIIFSLDMDRNENELEWFGWYYKSLIQDSNGLIELISRIEWKTNENNETIKKIEIQTSKTL